MLAKLNNSEFLKKNKVEYFNQLRIIKKNVIHIHNIPESMAIIDLLESKAYLGQYGKIIKLIVIYKANQENNKEEYSAYITYSNELEAALALLCVNSLIFEGKIIRASFGTTKYCYCFLNNKICHKSNKCNFLHHFINDKNIIFDNNNSFSYKEHLNLARKILNDYNIKKLYFVEKTHTTQKMKKNVFPNIDFIFLNEEEKEKYFTEGNIRYIKTNSCGGQKEILLEHNKYKSINKSSTNNNKSECSISKKMNDLSSNELYNIFRKSINHILVAKPLYMALKNVNVEKIELDYFLKDLSKNGTDVFELLDGCLDPISHLM